MSLLLMLERIAFWAFTEILQFSYTPYYNDSMRVYENCKISAKSRKNRLRSSTSKRLIMKKFYFDVISNKRSDVVAKGVKAILFVFSFFFSLASLLRKKLYQIGVFSSYRPRAYTISIGNITSGGSGKTPCTLYVAEFFQEKASCGIVLRPYKAKNAKKKPVRVTQSADPSVVGDEACLLARRLPNATIWSGQKKEAAKCADHDGVEVLIIDDGFQHFGLKRDLDFVIIDAHTPFGYGKVLPYGLLRELPSALCRADLILCNSKCETCTTKGLENEIRTYSAAPIIHVGYKFDGIYDKHNRKLSLSSATKVALFCGIATPESFTAFVQNAGFCVVDTLYIEDHEAPKQDALNRFSDACKEKGAEMLLCTQKDFVKTPESTLALGWVKISLQIFEGEKLLLSKLQSVLSRNTL